jgi:predicted RNA-binding Zn-ribbon protein involved in translation (DUF1610 family)
MIGKVSSKPRILLLDIETSPDLVWVWGVYEQNAIAVKEHWRMISFSAEWYHSKKNVTLGLDDTDKGFQSGSDDNLCDELWGLLDEADIVVAHNGVRFDVRKINARFIANDMLPPSPYKVVDTKREASRVAMFSSNKLDWLCKQLDLGSKIPHEGFALWQSCMEDDPKAWKRMKKYNRHDIELLREIYDVLAPWSRQPNANLWSKGIVCPSPTCGSKNLSRQGTVRMRTRSYQRFKCNDCGKWTRAVKSYVDGAKVVEIS